MQLESMSPNPTWTADAYEDTVETLREHDEVTYKVWGGDWCKDCRSQLPDFAAALDAAGVSEDRIEVFPVEREDGEKVGPGVEEYGIELIPTVVVERDASASSADAEAPGTASDVDRELFRFVEDSNVPAAVFVARHLDPQEDGD